MLSGEKKILDIKELARMYFTTNIFLRDVEKSLNISPYDNYISMFGDGERIYVSY